MKIGIVGSGISGLTCGYLLHKKYNISIFEKNDYVGGHTHTHSLDFDGINYQVDSGFIVFNQRTYPNFINLLGQLGIQSQPTSMSFSLSDKDSGLEYSGESLGALFAQKRNLFRPAFYKLLLEIYRFNRVAEKDFNEGSCWLNVSVGEYLDYYKLSEEFRFKYLLPLCGAIWSTEPAHISTFTTRFLLGFMSNHGLLGSMRRPQWQVVKGGSQQYVKEIRKIIGDRIHLNAPVTAIERRAQEVVLTVHGQEHHFDYVIFACHSDDALKILGNKATLEEKEILGAIPYKKNSTVLHTDPTVMPRAKKAWASWNYLLESGQKDVTVTYYMNHLQGLPKDHLFFVTLNKTKSIDTGKILKHLDYSHPHFGSRSFHAQNRHGEINNKHRTLFCGAYWGFGFHEDGVKSALRAISVLGCSL